MAKKKKVEIPERKVIWHIQDDGSVSPIIQNQKQDIAPVQTKQSGFFKGSDAKNNWSIETDNPFMNAVQRANATLWGTILDAGTNVVRGATSSVEGIGDFAQNRVADVQDLFGHNKAAEKTRRKSEQVWGINQKIDDFDSIMNTTSVLGDKSDAVFQGVGTSLFAMGTGALGGAIGGTNAAASILSLGTMGLGAAGNSENQARQEMMADLKKYGFNTKQINNASRMYGLLSGVGETLSEMMFGGISQTSKVLGIGSGVFDSADDAVINALTKRLKTGIFKNFVQAGLKASGEGVEEIASGFLDAAAKKLTYMKDEDFGKLLKDEKLLDSFISGTLSATLTQLPSYAKSVGLTPSRSFKAYSNNEIRDFVSNLNTQEQQVVEREIENRLAQEENPTNRKRMQIEKQVIEDLDRGYISANTIRETLGENYNPERDLRLNESFNEEIRRSQAYENDTSKYDEKQRATIQRAIDSGLLNNSNKTHDFVDLIAKLSADKGIDFDFTNNERIKESGFAIDGKQVNGFIQDGKVTLNLESNQALNKTVGHEITHVLEGTELYNNLQQSLKAYIGEKEWNNRISQLEKVYKNVEGANIQNELTSDLVGEHIFNDENFIKNLSTNNQNLFQKIFNEIKYMVKIATAGSKEARDLEKVKRAFEKAYRETSKTQKGTQYSLSTQQQLNDITNQRDSLRQELLELRKERGEITKTIPDYSMFKQYDELTDINKKIDDNLAKSKELYAKQEELKNKLEEEKEIKKKQEIEEINKKSTPFKEKQFKVLQKNNPMLDDYHTGIRQPGEIMTWEEAINDADESGEGYSWGDYTKEDALRDLDRKRVTIYSSYPIKNGTFVTPSKAQAEMYAGGEGSFVYSKTVNPDFVAWINVDEGQYANVGRNIENNTKYSLTDNQNNESEKITLADGRTYNNYYEYAKDITKNKDELAKELLFKHYSQNFDVPANSNETKFYHGTDATFDYDGLKVMDFDEQTMDRNYGDYFYITTDKDFSHTYGSQIAEFIIPNDKILSLEDYRQNYSNKTDDELFNDYWALEMPDNEYIVKDIKPIIDYSKQRANDYINQQENTQYSLSEAPKQDNQGRELTKNQQEFYKDVSPEVRDENGNLMSFYHGSNSEFTIFDITKSGESSKEAKVGFWFTPNKKGAENFANEVWYGDKTPTTYEVYLNIKNPKVYETYEVDQQQRDNMIQNRKNIEQEIRESSRKYSWTETGDYKVTSLYNDLVEMNRREKNGIRFKEDAQYNEEFYRRLAEERNIPNEKFNEMNQDAKNQVELETQKRKADDEFYSYVYSDAYEQFKTDLYLSAGMRAEDANVGGMGMMMKNENEAVANFVEGLKQEGYDGIVIKNTHYDNDSLGEGKNNNQYVAFYPNQIKNVDNLNPTDDADIRYQLGNNEVTPTSGWNVRSEDVRLQSAFQDTIAPLQEQVQELSNTINELKDNIAPLRAMTEEEANEYATQTQEAFENEAAPIRNNLTLEENQRMNMLELLERNNMMNDERRYEKEQLENKINPVYPTEEATPGQALSDIRDIDEVGKRNVKAYQYEHPEVKPYFQEEARGMLNDLNNSIKGERFINESQQRGQGTSYDVIGVKRFTSPEIAELLDSKYGYTYDDIRKGLNAIIEDHGAENIAVAKRIELVLDDNLRNGYTDWQTGTEIPPNQEYLNMLAEQEWQNYFDDINSQYPLEQLQEPQYNLEDEETDFSDVKIDKDLQDMTVDDLNLEPFLQGLVKADERQKARQEIAKEIGNRKEYTPKKKGLIGKAIDLYKSATNEFAVVDKFAKDVKNPTITHKIDTWNNYVPLAQTNITTAQTDINGKAIGRSWDSIWKEANKLGISEKLDEYTKHWSNIDRGKRGKGALDYSAKESYKKAQEIKSQYPDVHRLAKDIWQFSRNERHNLRDAGVISQQQSDILGRTNPHYIPFVSDNISNYFTETGELKPRRTIKRAKGGAELEGLLSVEEAMKSYIYSQFAETTSNDAFLEIIKSSPNQFVLGGDDRTSYVNQDHLSVDKDGYYLTAYENGEPITAQISKEMYDSLSRQTKHRVDEFINKYESILKPLEKFGNLRRKMLTELSPSFLAKNPAKDFQEAIINSKYTKDMIANYMNPQTWIELAKGTGEASQFRNLYGSGLVMGQYDIDISKIDPKSKNFNFLKKLGNANEYLELITRYAEFKASRQNGASIQEAMYNAREVTTNFSRGNPIVKAFNKYGMTFLNSSVQGFDKFIRNFSGENGAKGIVNSLAKAAIFGIAPAVFNELAFGSGDDKDEEYEALPDYIKDNYYIIKTGDGNFIRIPKGRVLSVFGSAARRTIEAMEGEENAFEGFLGNVQQQIGINNPEENNIFAPLIQAMGGRKLDSGQTAGSAWYGGDIIPSRLQKERPEDQYDASIDDFSIWLGQHTGISPYKINYVLDQYTGGIGDIGLPMITKEANSDGSLIAPIKDQFTADTITDNKYVSEFYDTKGKLYTGSKATDEDILKNKYMNSISSEMAKLYAERREVQADDSLTKQQKYAKSQAIKAEINRLAKEGMDNYNNIITSNNYAKIGDTEYYKNANGQWTKTTDDVASLGLDTEEKSEYYKVKNDIYTTKKNNDGNDKPLVVQDIVNSNLTPDAKVNLYTSNYKDDLIQPLVDSGMDVDSYLTYKSQNFTADKDSNGKSISGSKKQKVFDYINSMNVPYEQKLILAKSEYNSFNDNNYEIIEYIENTGMDYDERIQLYKSLGFKVDGDSISW